MRAVFHSLLTALACLGTAINASAMPILVDFEDVAIASGTSASQGALLTSHGFSFTTSLTGTPWSSSGLILQNDYIELFSPDIFQSPHGGSTHLAGLSSIKDPGFFGRFYTNVVTMTSTEGLSFSLSELELAEGFNGNFGGLLNSVTFSGTTVTGSEITQQFVLDGVFDGAGPGEDFESVVFGAQWSDLASFSIRSSDFANVWSIDNIHLTTGEPIAVDVSSADTVALLALGLLLLGPLTSRPSVMRIHTVP